jgi:hypothetical protein
MKRGDYAKFHGKLVEIHSFRIIGAQSPKKVASVSYVKDRKPKLKFRVDFEALEPIFNQRVPKVLYGK